MFKDRGGAGLGFRALGFRVLGLGFASWGFGVSRFGFWSFGLRGLGFKVKGIGFKVLGFGLKASSLRGLFKGAQKVGSYDRLSFWGSSLQGSLKRGFLNFGSLPLSKNVNICIDAYHLSICLFHLLQCALHAFVG